MDIEVNFNTLYRVGYLICDVPNDVSVAIESEINEMMDCNFKNCISYSNTLAGAIQHEYTLHKSANAIDRLISVIAPTYWNNYGLFETSAKKHYIRKNGNLPDLWVNFQRKYEHNPLHTHGGQLSFVIWHRVPYDIEEERKLPHLNRGNTPTAGVFYFNIPDFTARGGVKQEHIVVDDTKEGQMIIFPSIIQHGVYPFYTSDEYRISVSGNIDYR